MKDGQEGRSFVHSVLHTFIPPEFAEHLIFLGKVVRVSEMCQALGQVLVFLCKEVLN